MSKKRSDIIHSSASLEMNLFREGLLKGAGYRAETLKKRPLIAIANSHSELTTGHSHLDRLAAKVKEGILAAGGECAEFNVPAPCDGVAMAHDGMRYVLAQRDLIADMVETHMRSQPFDGLVAISGCDKINPGMMMAMGRLDMPAIFLAGGPGQMDVRNAHNNRSSIEHADYEDDLELMLKTITCSTCGACEIMGTANTFQCLSEALGLCLPGSANIPGWHSDKLDAARKTGERIVAMVAEGLNTGRILTREAFRNAVVAAAAIGGSTNTFLHLPAIARSAGIQLGLKDFEEASGTPTLLAIAPNGPWGVQDLWAAGGMPAVLKTMQDSLNTECLTVTGRTLGEEIEHARVRDPRVIPSRDKPFRSHAGIAVLRGNVAPDGCVVKQAGVSEDMFQFSGKARCFNSEEEALAAIYAGTIEAGEILVLRYQGPKGAPGMPEMLGVTVALKNAKLSRTALITDGRFSGGTSGPCIGHICPEAYDGGLIAFIEDGDRISIDIPNRRVECDIPDEALARRKADWKPVEKDVPRGFMQRYRKLVGPASEGAILE